MTCAGEEEQEGIDLGEKRRREEKGEKRDERGERREERRERNETRVDQSSPDS
ncbi:hypothetical protein [Halobiforma nitratireducens]|uniref:hypothetical protein n=1 Tax=Halobiforma nitratireducens TaxID=130048 RepID=UPI00146137A4|nr:hypothetical protein [Halobiforma nitratireducens]